MCLYFGVEVEPKHKFSLRMKHCKSRMRLCRNFEGIAEKSLIILINPLENLSSIHLSFINVLV